MDYLTYFPSMLSVPPNKEGLWREDEEFFRVERGEGSLEPAPKKLCAKEVPVRVRALIVNLLM